VKRCLLPPLFFTLRLPTLLATLWRQQISRPPISSVACKEPRSFIVYRLDSLGDVVLTTPLFRALKAADPKARCTVVVQSSYKSLLATNPYIDEVLALPDVKASWLPRRVGRLLAAWLLYCKHLRYRHFDFAVSPRWDVDEHLATFLCALTNAASRVGYSEKTSAAKQRINRGFDRAFDICLPPGPVRHEAARNLAIAEALGAASQDSTVELYVTERDRRSASRLLAKAPASARLVALGIGAASAGRRWPLERYADVVRHLEREHHVCPVIVCTGEEFGDAVTLAKLLPQRPIIVSGARLRDVAAVLERCELFIGNDSGAAHMAAATGCGLIVISRHPRNGDPNHFNSPVRFAPCGRQVHVLQPASGLDACRDACHSRKPHCIRQISAEEVAVAAREMLSPLPVVTETATAPAASDSAPVDSASNPLLQSHSMEAILRAIDHLNLGAPRPSV